MNWGAEDGTLLNWRDWEVYGFNACTEQLQSVYSCAWSSTEGVD
jgi:hypothetical protein